MRSKAVLAAAIAAGAVAWAAKDPVIMTVNGVDVPKSEFEYLYNKNSQQQLSPQPLEEYVEMFKLYKLKVADARAEGIDTMSAFRKEMDQYRHDLAAPYMADSVFLNKLVKEAYDRSKEEVQARHIMLMKSRDYHENLSKRQLLDSLRTLLLNGADFEDLARRYSQDRTAVRNGGNLGYITVNHFPYNFEETVFSTPEDEISEITESPVGYHLIKGGKRRPARGTILTSHIMKMSGEMPEAEAKAAIDSIYSLLLENPERFEELALRLSDDKNSARQGGLLPWFGAGEMVEEFDAAAFALQTGEISKPVKSPYGWHIIKKIDAKDIPSIEEIKKPLISRITNPQDERFPMVRKNLTDRLAKRHKLKTDSKTLSLLNSKVNEAGLDSAFYSYFAQPAVASAVIYKIDNEPYTVGDFIASMSDVRQPDPLPAAKLLEAQLDNYLDTSLVNAEETRLLKQQPEYRNLLKEYEDGSLLYEVSKNKVWDKAAKDQEGLEKYFELHRDDYKWKEPKVKGYLVQVANDSIGALVKNRLPQLGGDSIVLTIRKEFGTQAHIEKVLVSEGTNAIVDYLVFGGKKVRPSVANFTDYFLYDSRLITEPEEVSDVKGLVTSDYQNAFQTMWEEELIEKYPVVVNDKVLSKVRKR